MFDKIMDRILSEKTAQVSFVAGVMFFVIANQSVFKFVEGLLKKTLNVSLSGTPLLLLHSVLFAVIVGFVTLHVFQPLVGFKEGQGCAAGFMKDSTNQCKKACPAGNSDCPDGEYCDGNVCQKKTGGNTAPSSGGNAGAPCLGQGDSVCLADEYCDGLTCQKGPRAR